MATDVSKIKAEIKEWQRAYRRAHGRDPGKEELRNNPEMQAKYKIWQDSLKADKDKANRKSSATQETNEDETATTPPKHAPKSIVPKKMPVQSVPSGPSTPFSARKKLAQTLAGSPTSPQSEQSKQRAIPALNLSAAKPRPTPSMIPFDSASSAQRRTFPGLAQSMLDSDSDDDNPFSGPGPVSPTGSRSRRSSQLISPTKSMLYRQTSSTASTPQSTMKIRTRNFDLSPTRESGAMTPRTKARKRMRGEEVPATPGDKRRKLALGAMDKGVTLFGEPSSAKRLATDDDDDDDDEEILNSPRKKSALGAGGRVFTSMFDDVSSTKDDEASLRSTPPPPPSESGDSYAPDWEGAHSSEDDEPAPSTSRAKPVLPAGPSQWTQDTWDAPTPGTDLSHLRKGIAAGKAKTTEDAKKGKAKQDAKKGKEKSTPALANPFELLPPMPGEETAKPGRRYDNGEPKSKGRGKAKRDKEAVEVNEGDDQSDGDAVGELNEVEWRPHGPLRAGPALSQPFVPLSQTQTIEPDEESEGDPVQDLPSDLRTLLSIKSTHRDDIKTDTLARDVLAGRSKRGGDVWGIGDVESNDEGDDYERDDWDSEPEGWAGGVEM